MKITGRHLRKLVEAFVTGADGSVSVPSTAQQRGQGLPKSVKLRNRIASLLAVGLNATNNHNFQIYKQDYSEEIVGKIEVLMNATEEDQVLAINLADTIGLFEDADTLKGVAMNAIKTAPEYAALISDVTNYLKGTRSDSLYYTDYRNQTQEYSPMSYIDMVINKCLDKHFRLYSEFILNGRFKPNSGYYSRSLTGYDAIQYLGIDHITTGVLSSTVTPSDSSIYNMMLYTFDEEGIGAGVAQQKLRDPRQAYIEGDDPFVVIKFTVYCDYEGSEGAYEPITQIIDDNYNVFVTREPETYEINYASGTEESTYYMITVSGRLSEFEVTSVDEIYNSWMDEQMYEADRVYSSDGFNRPCNMKISEYEEEVLYNNIKELGEIIMKVARKMNYGPAEVENLRKLITTDQTKNEYYREELAILMATYSDMIGFTKDLARDIQDETGVSLDEVINPESYR